MSATDPDAARIVRLLNSTRELGFDDGDVLCIFEDYFATGERNDHRDEPDGHSDDDDDDDDGTDPDPFVHGYDDDDDDLEMNALEKHIHDAVGCVRMEDLDDQEDPGDFDDVEVGVTMAAQIAQEKIDFVTLEHRTNHCKCKLLDNPKTNQKESCINQFTEIEEEEIRMNVRDMTPYEKNLLLLGMVCSSINDAEMTLCSKQKEQQRKLTRLRWFYIGHKRVCRDTFMYLMETCKQTITQIKQHYLEHGLTPRRKNSGGRQNNKHALSFEDVKNMVRFVLNFAQEHAIVLPGHIPGFSRTDIKVLPSQLTKVDVWRHYRESALEAGERSMGLATFRKLWLQLIPYVVIAKPASDLCWTCQHNNNLIVKKVNVDEEEKAEALKNQEKHLYDAKAERALYRQLCRDAKILAKASNITSLGRSEPCSRDMAFHYSFDYGQQVHYPSHPVQPGPICFKTPRKCHIFGIHAEGLTQQVNYLVDEASFCGKGVNAVMSMLHHFLENYGVGETELHLTVADSCLGQKKNNAMLHYLCWRTLVGLHNKCAIHFLLPGHTKFAPDWCFGLLKRRYRSVRVSSLQEVSEAVRTSTEKGINQVQLVGDEAGNTIVPTQDWTGFLSKFFRRFSDAFKLQHHFRFDKDSPGVLFYKTRSEAEEQQFRLGKRMPPRDARPDTIPPKGLDMVRQVYLYHEIREFCTPETRDLTCPRPPGYIDEATVDDAAQEGPPEPVIVNSGGKRKSGNGPGKTVTKRKRAHK